MPLGTEAGQVSAAQWFVFGGWVFDISAAKKIIRAAPRETVSLPAAPWARAYGLDRDPGRNTGTVPLPGPGPGFDRGCAMTTDLAQPVLVATLPAASGPPCPLLIDGTHRTFKAHATGAADLPACLLTEAPTRPRSRSTGGVLTGLRPSPTSHAWWPGLPDRAPVGDRR